METSQIDAPQLAAGFRDREVASWFGASAHDMNAHVSAVEGLA